MNKNRRMKHVVAASLADVYKRQGEEVEEGAAGAGDIQKLPGMSAESTDAMLNLSLIHIQMCIRDRDEAVSGVQQNETVKDVQIPDGMSENEEGVIYTCPLRVCVSFTDAIMERRSYKELFVS